LSILRCKLRLEIIQYLPKSIFVGDTMGLTSEERKIMLHYLLDMGELLLSCGAEISRVEDTLTRMGIAYGAETMNVFVITSSIVITMVFPNAIEVTETRRIRKLDSTNFKKLEDLNELSRQCCIAPLPLDQLHQRLNAIHAEEANRKKFIIGSILGAFGFAIFFGGTILDGLACGLVAILIVFLQRRLGEIAPNTIVFNFLAASLVGVLIVILSRIFPVLHMDKIMIGDIMLLIPGIAMTNSIRNMLVGDTISGIMRLIESLLWAGALALGFMTVMLIS